MVMTIMDSTIPGAGIVIIVLEIATIAQPISLLHISIQMEEML